MLNIFNGIFDAQSTTVSPVNFLICVVAALIIGIMYMFAYSFKAKSSSSFRMSLLLLPSVVCVVIMMVNGNVGTGIAVAGAFSLVRFRSAQGTAREICTIFMTMCSGLICGVGYLAYGVLFSAVMCTLLVTFNCISARKQKNSDERLLKITVPESLNYPDEFDTVFEQYTQQHELIRTKTTNMGSLYNLTYNIKMKPGISEKTLIDNLRIRNGNLEIMVSKKEDDSDEL